MKVIAAVAIALIVSGCSVPIPYNDLYSGSPIAQRDYTYANIAIHKILAGTYSRKLADEAEYYGLKSYYEEDPRSYRLLEKLYSNTAYKKYNPAYANFFCRARVKNLYWHHSLIPMQKLPDYKGQDLALIRTRREVDRELAERKEAIRHSYQICYNRYGNAVSMPIIVLKKGTYRIASIKPIYTIQQGKTINFVQAMENLVGDRVAHYKNVPLAKSRFRDDYDYFLKK